MASPAGNEDGDLGFQIAPMIDVVFVMLLFFIFLRGQKEIEIPGTLPAGSSVMSSPPVAVEVAITSEGSVAINNKVLGQPDDKTLFALRDWFRTIHRDFGSKDPVFICPAPDTQHERVMDVLVACRAADVPNVAFR